MYGPLPPSEREQDESYCLRNVTPTRSDASLLSLLPQPLRTCFVASIPLYIARFAAETQMTTPGLPQTTVPSVLLPELLGFVPQFLLDDIIDTANDAVRQAVEAMEVFLRRWASEREKKVDGDWDSTQEIEQGLVAFQTLLNSHVDIAFDFFEAWSLRNIFAIPPDLPLVAPHHARLNLEYTANEETELVNEIKELRRKIQAVHSYIVFMMCKYSYPMLYSNVNFNVYSLWPYGRLPYSGRTHKDVLSGSPS